LRHVETSMRGGKLRLEWHGQLRPTHGMKVKLSSASLTGARLTGAVRLTATKVAGKGFYLDGTGATRVTVDGKVKELMATITGAFSSDGVKRFSHEPDPHFDFRRVLRIDVHSLRAKHAAGRDESDRGFHGIRRRTGARARSDDSVRRFGRERSRANDDRAWNNGFRIVRANETNHGGELSEVRRSRAL